MRLSPVLEKPQVRVSLPETLCTLAPVASVVVSVTSLVSVFWKYSRVSSWSIQAPAGVHRCCSCSVLRLVSLFCRELSVMLVLVVSQPWKEVSFLRRYRSADSTRRWAGLMRRPPLTSSALEFQSSG